MEINSHEIATPYDYPWGYSPLWRQEIASRMMGMRDTPIKDHWIRAQFHYLSDQKGTPRRRYSYRSMRQRKKTRTYSRMVSVREANAIYEDVHKTGARNNLEALLLCPEVGYDDIGAMLRMSVGSVTAYERLFYNIRDDYGKVQPSPWLREFFVRRGDQTTATANMPNGTPLYWKITAFESGHTALMTIWGWRWPDPSSKIPMPDAEMYMTMFRELFKRLDQNLRSGTLRGKEAVDLMKEIGFRIADLRDKGILSEEDNMSDDTLMGKVLQLMARKMVLPDASKKSALQEELQNKVDSMASTEIKATGNTLDRIAIQLQDKGAPA